MIAKVLVDTNVFLSLLNEKEATDAHRKPFLKPRRFQYLFSHASAWEIAIKYGIGKLRLPEVPELLIPERVRQAGFVHLSIELQHVLRVHSLPPIHKDPFDRLLISQAMIEGIPVLTHDRKFGEYGVTMLSLEDVS